MSFSRGNFFHLIESISREFLLFSRVNFCHIVEGFSLT